MSSTVKVSIPLSEDLYRELAKRARAVGTNVQAYIRTLLERHVSRAKGFVHKHEVDEVGAVLRLKNMVKNLKNLMSRDFQGVKVSSTCINDVDNTLRDIVEAIEEKIRALCRESGADDNSCEHYTKFKQLYSKIAKAEDIAEKLRILASQYEDYVLEHMKNLFFLERCSLSDIAALLSPAVSDVLHKLLDMLLELS